MLVSLSIRSFLLIDTLDLQAGAGFTALTGETGAGKSMLLSALHLTLGGPAKRDQIAPNAEQAVLVAAFELADDHPVWAFLEEHAIAMQPGEALLLKRIVRCSGPSRSFVNDVPVSQALLSEIGAHLVEIHGQHASTTLLRPATHRTLLDRFGNLDQPVQACRKAWQISQEMRQRFERLKAEQDSVAADANICRQAIVDLTALAPEPDEFAELVAQRKILSHAAKFMETVQLAQQQLEQDSLRQGLCQADRALSQLSELGALEDDKSGLRDQLDATREAVERTLIELTEAQGLTTALARRLEHDPHKLEAVDERLAALRLAARTYGSLPEDLPATLARFQLKLAAYEDRAVDLAKAQQAVDQAHSDWRHKAERLSQGRKKAARKLEAAMRAELKPLRLERVMFRVALIAQEDAAGGALGQEQVTFEIETNPGVGFGPLHQIASGGELSRFSLALKCALQRAKTTAQTLIFDEIDQGVGGAVATAIGARLGHLSQLHQVLAITHSPQVAACAKEQWRVSKRNHASGLTSTEINALNKQQRLEEIARMLSGSSITDEARAAASKLLEVA